MKKLFVISMMFLSACQATANVENSIRPEARPVSVNDTTVRGGIELGQFPTKPDYTYVENYLTNGSKVRPGSYAQTRKQWIYGTRTSYYVPDDWTDIDSPLSDISVYPNWKFVSDYNEYMSRTVAKRWVPDIDVSKCASAVVEWYNTMQRRPYQAARCGNEIATAANTGNYQPLERAIKGLYAHGMWPINNHDGGYGHSYGQLLYSIVVPYVIHRDQLDLDHKKIDSWLADRADNMEPVNLDWGNNTIQPRCHPKNMQKDIVFVDDCNDTRSKITMTKLLMGLQTNNQALFDEGVEAFHYLSQFYDSKGVYIGTAMRGGQALHYSQSWLQLMSMHAEIFASVGYDLMNHQMPNGMTYAEIMTYQYNTLWSNDVSDLYPYAKLGIGQKGKSWHTIKGGAITTNKMASMYQSRRWAKATSTKTYYPDRNGVLVDQIMDTNALYYANR